MDKKWRQSIFQPLPLDGRYFLTSLLIADAELSLLNCFFFYNIVYVCVLIHAYLQ